MSRGQARQWLWCFAHLFMVLTAGGMCSTLLLLLTHNFCSQLFRSGSGCFGLFCIFLPRIYPSCTCTQLFLVPCSFFACCCLRRDLSGYRQSSTTALGPRSQSVCSTDRRTQQGRVSSWLLCILFNTWYCLPFSFQPFQWHQMVILICIAPMSNTNECLFVCFIAHLGILFGKETVHIFCLGRFLIKQAQRILDSLQRDSFRGRSPCHAYHLQATFSSGGNQLISGKGSPLVLEANKPGLNPNSASDQCYDSRFAFAMDEMIVIIHTSKRTL